MGFLFVLKRIGFIFVDHWRSIVIGLALLLIIVAVAMTSSRCGKRQVKLNETEILAAQQSIATNDRKAMVEILVASEVREKAIDANVTYSETKTINAIADARKSANALTNKQLAERLEAMK